ncbi:MAG: hypothetical protein ABIA04_10920 [Pseudomonadota bacterium]
MLIVHNHKHKLDSGSEVLKAWIKKSFQLNDKSIINIDEIKQNKLQINIKLDNNESFDFEINKELKKITYSDFKKLLKSSKAKEILKSSNVGFFYKFFFRFIAWWIALTGFLLMFAVCPHCGQPACVIGGGTAGILGGIMAFFTQNWKAFFSNIKSKIKSAFAK